MSLPMTECLGVPAVQEEDWGAEQEKEKVPPIQKERYNGTPKTIILVQSQPRQIKLASILLDHSNVFSSFTK